METRVFNSAYGELTLFRRPFRPRETLQAWDAADDYLLHYLAELNLADSTRILIVNDSFGSLSTALAQYSCTLWADSAISELCSAENAERNKRPAPQFIPATAPPTGKFDVILGLAAALLLRILGVSTDDVMDDYLATNTFTRERIERIVHHINEMTMHQVNEDVVRVLFKVQSRFLNEAYKSIDEHYGNFASFVEIGLGFGEAECGRLRELLLEPAAGI